MRIGSFANYRFGTNAPQIDTAEALVGTSILRVNRPENEERIIRVLFAMLTSQGLQGALVSRHL